ncbi:MAG TPA: ArgE/DapE family deacylase [Kineosporiaceae bacterium]|nr:ArgE/DapE family deacylase [Kineosporiaceae bacterium]
MSTSLPPVRTASTSARLPAARAGDSGLTDTERAVLDAVHDLARDGALTRDLTTLLAIPSVTGSAAEADAQAWVARRLDALGLEVDHWRMDVDDLAARPGFPGTEAPRDEAWGVTGTTPADAAAPGPTLVLQGHVDVVPAGDPGLWDGNPFTPRVRREGGRDVMVGRGACDMKGGLVSVLAALAALRAAGVRPAGRLAVHSVVGEEDGGLGAFGTLARGHRGDACVIPEPTDRRVVTAAAGALTFRLEVAGRAVHGSARADGVSAFEAFLPVHAALLELERERCADPDPLMAGYRLAYPLSVGTIRSGDWASTVPDTLVAEGRYGVKLGEDPAVARAAFEAAVAGACDPWLRDHPVRVTWWGGQFASGALPTGHELLPLVQDAWADATGRTRPAPRGVPYGSDLRLYAAAGVPTLHLGPGDVRRAHTAGEYVPLDEVEEVAGALALTVLRFCGVAGQGRGA